MPPKSKKAVKGKVSSVVDGLSTEEMSKDQLEEHIVRLREELDREREERSYFQLERDKIQGFWEICKRNVEESKAELRNRSRERGEEEERHRVEITSYKQKLKHVLSEHHDSVSVVKSEGVTMRTLTQEQHTHTELQLHTHTHRLQAERREKRLHKLHCTKELKLKHQVELMELVNDYDHRIREIEQKFHTKSQRLVSAAGKSRSKEMRAIDERSERRVERLIQEQDREKRGAEEYYTNVQRKILQDQAVLKDEHTEAVKHASRADKLLSVAEEENKRLSESLREAEQKLPEIQDRLQLHTQAREDMVVTQARVKLIEKELRDLSVEYELLLQAFEKVEQERDELLHRQTEAILSVQQQNGLREMIVQRKMAALSEALERKDAQLCSALSVNGSTDANSKLQDLLESKDVAIGALHRDLDRDCKEYNVLLKSSEEKLKTLGVSLFNFPFKPSEQMLGGPLH